MELPLFPLSSIVLPEGMLQLRIFEARYIEMVKQCFRNESGFGVCLIKEGHEVGSPAEPYQLGTLVKIVDWDQGSDGLLQITVQGDQLFRLHSWASNNADLLIGEVELLPAECPQELEPKFKPLAERLSELLVRLEHIFNYPNPNLHDAAWVCNRLIEIIPLSPMDKITLLQMQCNNDRLKVLQDFLFNQSEPSEQDT